MSANICSICLDEITETSQISTLECNHPFHKECIEEWIKVSKNKENTQELWSCPLCRMDFVNSDTLHITEETIEDGIRTFTLIKFKSDRFFIQIFTFSDIIFSLYLISYSYNIIYVFNAFCSMYGFIGAKKLHVGYLHSYSIFCIISLILKLINITFIYYVYLQQTTPPESIILKDPVYVVSIIGNLFLQLYITCAVTRVCNQINKYGEELRELIA
tara:strand:- start:2230 stop:2877 length:648 start_codon:yes stop_codon:yes gene_type:complete